MDDETRNITLPSGRVALMRPGKGRDLVRAHRAVAANPEPMAVSFALIAELAQIEGKTLVYEDVLNMDLGDVLVLQAEAFGGSEGVENFTVPPAPVQGPVDNSD